MKDIGNKTQITDVIYFSVDDGANRMLLVMSSFKLVNVVRIETTSLMRLLLECGLKTCFDNN